MGFAQEQSLTANAFSQPKPRIQVDSESNSLNTIYLKMGASESELPKNDQKLMPGFGLGFRHADGHHAVDVSAEGNRREIRDAANERVVNYSYTLPKINYLFYVTPESNSSFYAGAGVALGGKKDISPVAAKEEVKAEDGTVATAAVAAHNSVQEFHGFIPNAVVGFEFGRKSDVRTFAELSVSQPTVAIAKEGNFFGPQVALNLGLGF